MDKRELQERMTVFAVRIVKMVDSMPSCSELLNIIAKSIVTSKTRMNADVIAKSKKS